MPKYKQAVEGRPLPLRQLPKRQVARFGPIRHPLGNHIERWRQNDQRQLITVDSNWRGRRLVVLKGLRQGRQDHVRVVVAQLLPPAVKLPLQLGLLFGCLLAGSSQLGIRSASGAFLRLGTCCSLQQPYASKSPTLMAPPHLRCIW